MTSPASILIYFDPGSSGTSWRPPICRPIVFLTVTFDKRKKVRLKIQHPISIKNVLSVDVMNMFLLCYIQWQTHLYIHLYLLTVFPRSANILFIKWSFDLRRNWQHRYRPLSYENKHDLLSTSKYFGKYRQMPLRTIYFPVLRIPRRFLSGIQRSTQNFYPRIKLSDIPIYWNIIYHVSVFC